MGSFFRKDEDGNPKLEGRESAVPSEKLIEGASSESSPTEEVTTELSIHPDWELPKEDIYAYQFLNNECSPLPPNQISVSGISLIEIEPETFQVSAFIRNSLDRPVEFGDMIFALFDENEKILGRKAFDFRGIGTIPPRSSRPWNFIFTKKDLFTTDLPQTGWLLTFVIPEAPKKHALDMPKEWKEALPKADQKRLADLVDSLEPPKTNELNFMGLQASPADDGGLHITFLIRNGQYKDLEIKELTLLVEDAVGDLAAKGTFTFDNFIVKGNTTKPWALAFPKEAVLKQNADYSSWKVSPAQTK